MSTLAFARRTLQTLVRDRVTVFFSLLAPLILLLLYVAFFGKMTMDELARAMPAAAPGTVGAFTTSWVVAAIVTVTVVSAPIVGLTHLVEDRSSGRLSDFLVSPLTRGGLMGGYLIATSVYTAVVTALVGVIGGAYLLVRGYGLPGLGGSLKGIAALALAVVTFSAMSVLVGSFLRSSGAATAASTLIGTFVGFLAGAYVPPGVLSEGIVTAMNAMPFAQTAVLVRDGLATRPLDALGGGSTQGVDALRDMYGMDLVFGGAVASSVWAWVGLAVFGVVFFAGSALRARSLKAR